MANTLDITFQNCLLTFSRIAMGYGPNGYGPAIVRTEGWEAGSVTVNTISGTDTAWKIDLRRADMALSFTPENYTTTLQLTPSARTTGLFVLSGPSLAAFISTVESATLVNIMFHLRRGFSVGVSA